MREPDPDCEECGGTGFIVLWDYDGPGLHDEDNCPCRERDDDDDDAPEVTC